MNKSNTPSVWPSKNGIRTKSMKTIAIIIGSLCVCASPLLAADPFAVVDIPDPTLRAAIRATLDKPTGEITTADMESLAVLDASRSARGCAASIQSLEGLQTAINLTSLNLSGAWGEPIFLIPGVDHCATPAVLETGDLSPLSSLGKLQSLFLSGNGLSNLTFPTGLTNLQTLDLSENDFEDLALRDDMTNLQSLSLNGVSNTSFLQGLPRLRQLTWSVGRWSWWMGWESPGELVFPQGLHSLEHLTLYGAMTNLVFPSDLTNLHTLQLHGDFSGGAFLNPLWNLRTLILNYNRLTTLPPGLSNLVELSLSGNPLSDLSFLNDLQKLSELSLSGCALSNVTGLQFLNTLSQLRKLDLGYNGFTGFQLPPESRLTNLVELNLAGNSLAHVSLLNLERLTMLNLSRCTLANQADIHFLDALTHLRSLDLTGNRFNRFQIPAELTSLESLSLLENGLTNFILTQSLPKLEELNLGGNALTHVNLAPVQRSLKRLNLSYNPLTELPFLANFSQLEVLDFYTRDLTSFTLPWGLTSLRTLGLREGMLVPSEVPAAESEGAKLKITVVSPNFTYVGIPDSTDLSRLTLHGHWKNRVTVIGLWMRPPTPCPNGKIGFRISGAAGRTVQVQTSTDLANWDNWQSVVLGQNGAELFAEPSASQRYFRIVGAEGH